MPQFTSEHPRETYKVQGMELTMPSVFGEGHPLTALEAKWLNANVASAIGNAYGGEVRRGIDAITEARMEAYKKAGGKGPKPAEATIKDLDWDHQAKLDEKFTAYELGVTKRGGGGKPKDPLKAIANRIASDWVRAFIRGKGLKVKTFMDAKNKDHGSEFGRLVHDYLTAKHDEVYAQAQAEVDARGAANEGVSLDLGSLGKAA